MNTGVSLSSNPNSTLCGATLAKISEPQFPSLQNARNSRVHPRLIVRTKDLEQCLSPNESVKFS